MGRVGGLSADCGPSGTESGQRKRLVIQRCSTWIEHASESFVGCIWTDQKLTWWNVGEKMEIHLNVSFPRVPCELLTLDVMDVSGEVQAGVMHGVNKVRLAPEAEGGAMISSSALEL